MITLNDLCAQLLPPDEQLTFKTLIINEDHLILVAAMMSPKSTCPDCFQPTDRIHSSYWRTLADLPWASTPIELRLTVRRFFCCTCTCARQTFSERLPKVAPLYARTTTRLATAQAHTGLFLGGAPGSRKLLKQRIGEVTSDTFIEPKERRATVGDLLDALESDYQLRGGRAHKQFRSHLHPVREAFGHLRAINITAARIDRYVKHRLADGKKPATVNRETQLLGQAFKLGQEHGMVQRVPRIRRLPERNTRQGFFEQDEFEEAVTHLPDYLKYFVRFAYLSGWRKGEIAHLQWSDVDREARIVRLRPDVSKTQDGRVLVLDDDLWDLTERRWQVRESVPWVFHRQGFQIGDFKKAWRTACRKAGVPGKLFHDLRRTAPCGIWCKRAYQNGLPWR